MNCSSELGVIAAGAGALPGARRRCEAGKRTHGPGPRTCRAVAGALTALALGFASFLHAAETTVSQTAAGATWSLNGETSPVPGGTYTYTITRTAGTQPGNEYAGFHVPSTSTSVAHSNLGSNPTSCGTGKYFCASFSPSRSPGIWNNIQDHHTIYTEIYNNTTITATLAVTADTPIGTTISFGAIESNGRPRSGGMLLTVATAPTVTDVDVTSMPAVADTYGTGEQIEFTVTFDQAVTITGTPEFEFSMNSAGQPSNPVRAAYDSTASTATMLVFSYTVKAGDVDNNGVWFGDQTRTIKLDTGDTIRGTVGALDAVLIHDAGDTQSGHKVNGEADTTVPNTPGAPTGLTATASGLNRIDLSWTAPSNNGGALISGYKIEVSSDSGATWYNLVANTYSVATTYADTRLAAGTTRHYRVSAINSAGTSNPSNIDDATTDPAAIAPGAPTGLTATASGLNRIDLSWTAPSNNGGALISGYKIEVSSDSGATWYNLVANTYSVATTYADTRLAAGTTRHYRVSAINSAGTSNPSNIDDATTDPAAIAPGAPTGLTATASGLNRIDLSWTAPSNNGGALISGYKIEVSSDSGATWYNLVANTYSVATTYADTRLAAGTTRHYRVSAINSAGTSNPSNIDDATTDPAAIAPGAPTGLTATASGLNRIDLSWTAPSNNGGALISGYKIEVSSDSGATWYNLVANTYSVATTYADTRLAAGTTRHYRVSAINSAGTSNPSNIDDATAATAPGAPTGLTATASGPSQIDLSWTAPSNNGGALISGYKIEVSPDSGTIWYNLVANTYSVATTYADTRLAADTTRHYSVLAINSAGTSNPSNIDDATTDPAATAAAPTGLSATTGDQQVTLSWTAPASNGGTAITSYEYEQDGSGAWTTTGGTSTSYTVTNLNNGQSYTFEVRAVNSVGPSPASNQVAATPMAEEVILEFAHFGNGVSGNDVLITSDLVLVNVAENEIRPVIYFFDRAGDLLEAESVVDLGDDLEVEVDGGLSPTTAMDPLGELTISTHGRGEVMTGSVRVVSDGPIGGVVRFDIPGIGVAGVGASEPTGDALFPARRQAGGIRTAAAIHNLGMEPVDVQCRLMKNGAVLEERAIELDANGQDARFIEELFTATDTTDFVGSVRCTVPHGEWFTGVAVELDSDNRIFTTLPVVPVDPEGGEEEETTLTFAHFANGTSGDGTLITSDLVLVNVAASTAQPAIYFYDQRGEPLEPESMVEVGEDLVVREDGGLTVRTAMPRLGELTISTHGRGEVVTGSVQVVATGPIGGVLRFDIPGIGVAGVGASQPLADALFPARRQAGTIRTAAAIRNLEPQRALVRCRLMSQGEELEQVDIRLDGNGQNARFIEEVFTRTDTTDFVGSVRCTAAGDGMFTGVAVELDTSNRIFTTLPVVPVQR